MLKSRIHWRAGLGKLAKAVVECAGVGVSTSDYSQLRFNKVRRPIYPLDLRTGEMAEGAALFRPTLLQTRSRS
jgi:microcystin degradation protein MlrC